MTTAEDVDNLKEAISDHIMQYGVDSADQVRLMLNGKSIPQVDRATFAEKLYVKREVNGLEQELLRQLNSGGPILCVVGGRGYGKTSALYWAQHQINKITKSGDYFLIIDLRKGLNTVELQGLTEETGPAAFKEYLRKLLLYEFFSGGRAQFVAWTLAGPPDDTDQFDSTLVAEFSDLSEWISVLADSTHEPNRVAKRLKIAAYLARPESAFAMIRADQRVQVLVRPAHVIQAAIKLKFWSKLILVYDNVDQLPARLQASFLGEIESTHVALSGSCSTAIAIRLENVVSCLKAQGGAANPVKVLLAGGHTVPGVLMDNANESLCTTIIDRRLAFAQEMIRHAVVGAVPSHRSMYVDEAVTEMNARAVKGILKARIDRLGNHSLRSFLAISNDFTKYLKRNNVKLSSGDLNALVGDPQHLETVFFLWLFRYGIKYSVIMHDVLKVSRTVERVGDVQPHASAHHLLLTCLYNYQGELTKSGEKGTDLYPAFRHILKRMKDLRFSLPDVRVALEDLCELSGSGLGSIEFTSGDVDPKRLSESSVERLRLTPCGEELVESVYSKVGYVWGRAYEQQQPEDNSGDESYFMLSVTERMRVLIAYMIRMSRQHLLLLESIRDSWIKSKGKDWLQTYRKRFGVRGALQVERILSSATAFYGPQFEPHEKNPFHELLVIYGRILDQMASGHRSGRTDMSEFASVQALLPSREL